jgi:hypothetical protein
MNFKLKALVAAAVMAASAPALAVMADATSGNGELLVNLRFYTGNNNDGGDGADISAVFDLGITMNDFLANPGLMNTIDLTSANYGTAWADVMAVAGANAGLIEYNVIALDNTKTTTAGGSRYLTTANVATFPALANLNMNNFTFMNSYVTGNNSRGTHVTEANGASTATSAEQNVYFGKINGTTTDGDNWAVQTTADTTKTLGTAQNFWFLTTSSTTNTAQATKSPFGLDLDGDGKIGGTTATANEYDKFLLGADGKLGYVAAVPEASTYGMMLAGLGLVGFMARRRLQS